MKTVLRLMPGVLQTPEAPCSPVAYGRKHGVLRNGYWLLACAIVAGTATPSPAVAVPESPTKSLWYEAPAAHWLEALPVGNGCMGAMVFGGVTADITWRDGRVTSYRLRTQQPKQLTVRVNGQVKVVSVTERAQPFIP